MKPKFYITTTLPYVNASPHIGFAMEIVRADIIARYKKQKGFDSILNTGTDEHGIKVYREAIKRGIDPKGYVDEYAEKFKNLHQVLGLSDPLLFTRTTNSVQKKAAQEFWKVCKQNGFIDKGLYNVKYCVGCELEKMDSELDNDGHCPIHPLRDIELIVENNYFFKFSLFQKKLLDFYEQNPDFVVPDFRYNEIKNFVASGIRDFSISRLKSKMPWGVEVPDDTEHVMYAWFDALINYVSAIGWPDDMEKFNRWWPVTQYCGKDNLRQQSAMWQAMLMAAGLPPSRQIIINGFINIDGQKMSKSQGSIADPYAIVKEYGTDTLRYYIARELSSFEDSDYTPEKFLEAYNAGLANGLGNLVSRTLKMSEMYFNGDVKNSGNIIVPSKIMIEMLDGNQKTEGWGIPYEIKKTFIPKYEVCMEKFEINKASEVVWTLVSSLDHYISDYEPFKLIKTDKEKTEAVVWNVLYGLYFTAQMLEPIMPETALKIQLLLGTEMDEKGEFPKSFKTKLPEAPLFLRK